MPLDGGPAPISYPDIVATLRMFRGDFKKGAVHFPGTSPAEVAAPLLPIDGGSTPITSPGTVATLRMMRAVSS